MNGEKVICVDDSGFKGNIQGQLTPEGLPIKDRIYVVGAPVPDVGGEAHLSIIGLRNLFRGDDIGWRARRFRSLTELKREARLKQPELQPK